jgi:RNA polymerase sigma-70 factor (ECF subfamily)
MTADMVSLIEPMIPALRRYARALLRDRVAADDLVQDCLERAVGHWHQRRSGSNPQAWIFAILHNLAMTRLKRAARTPPDTPIETADDRFLGVAATQEDGLRYNQLLAALETVPDEQRAVLLLVGVEGLSYAETAQAIGVPVGTVMSRLARGRERLRKTLSGEGQSEHQSEQMSQRPHLRSVK